ncbi:MAG: dihydrodipicolinate synthase family protein, partial [Bradyrhizobium sp.]|uniref:dihydrodipicolinate synthase family protein n=1 Tax=Bradyrhizobium sp. TaxID=376 RepID=UPI001DCFB96E
MGRFGGVYPVLYAFFDRQGRIDPGAMRAQIEHCIDAGAHGITVLGLVTEVKKLATAERQDVVELVGRAIGGRVRYAVTVAEQDEQGQIEFARMAAANGADWVILQPPPGRDHGDASLARHFGAIADAAELPVAIQNNPVNLESALSPGGLVALVRAHPNIRLLKAEGHSLDIAAVLDALGGAVDAFGGHGGLEFLALMRSGGAGLIPAPDCVAIQVAMYEALTGRDPAAIAHAERLHKEILPLIVFMTQGIPVMWCYGKRLMARRLGMG